MTEPVDAPTEKRNPRTAAIDRLSAIEILRLLNEEDSMVAGAVAAVLPDLARAVEIVADRLRAGGTMHYFGAGTSGRLGALDAAELPPTFAVPKTLVVAHHAGGTTALREAVENVEDDEVSGAADAAVLTSRDVAVGIAASGRTPYVRGALVKARALGAATILVTANPGASLAPLADVHVGPDTGAEAIAGSTRLKAGTATKLVLNSLSTAVMVLLGRTYSNLMVHMLATNEKLRGRSVRILAEASGAAFETCEQTLADAGGDVRVALVALLAGVGTPEASDALASGEGTVRAALAKLG